jgi:hypothetical protein
MGCVVGLIEGGGGWGVGGGGWGVGGGGWGSGGWGGRGVLLGVPALGVESLKGQG